MNRYDNGQVKWHLTQKVMSSDQSETKAKWYFNPQEPQTHLCAPDTPFPFQNFSQSRVSIQSFSRTCWHSQHSHMLIACKRDAVRSMCIKSPILLFSPRSVYTGATGELAMRITYVAAKWLVLIYDSWRCQIGYSVQKRNLSSKRILFTRLTLCWHE